jgi:hypothetical protein
MFGGSMTIKLKLIEGKQPLKVKEAWKEVFNRVPKTKSEAYLYQARNDKAKKRTVAMLFENIPKEWEDDWMIGGDEYNQDIHYRLELEVVDFTISESFLFKTFFDNFTKAVEEDVEHVIDIGEITNYFLTDLEVEEARNHNGN